MEKEIAIKEADPGQEGSQSQRAAKERRVVEELFTAKHQTEERSASPGTTRSRGAGISVEGCMSKCVLDSAQLMLARRRRGQETTKIPPEEVAKRSEGVNPRGTSSRNIKVLYLFAGERRKTSVATYLREMAQQKGFHIDIEEVDIARRLEDDLSLQSKQEEFLEGIREGRWDAVICTPPCSTWSRVRHH